MTEKVKRQRGRPATRDVTRELREMDAVLANARALWGDRFNVDDPLTNLLAATDSDIGHDLIKSHGSTMPRTLILAIESAGPDHMSVDDVDKAVSDYRDHQRMVTENRKQGQELKKAAAAEEARQLLRHPRIQSLADRIKPRGNLSPHGAASIAYAILKEGLEQGTRPPSLRKWRGIFTMHQRNLLAEQRP